MAIPSRVDKYRFASGHRHAQMRQRNVDNGKWRRRRGVWRWLVASSTILLALATAAEAAPSPQATPVGVIHEGAKQLFPELRGRALGLHENARPLAGGVSEIDDRSASGPRLRIPSPISVTAQDPRTGLGVSPVDQRKWTLPTNRQGVGGLVLNPGNNNALTGDRAHRFSFSQGASGTGSIQTLNKEISNQKTDNIGKIRELEHRVKNENINGLTTEEVNRLVNNLRSSTSARNQRIPKLTTNLGVSSREATTVEVNRFITDQGPGRLTSTNGVKDIRLVRNTATNQGVGTILTNQGTNKLGTNQRANAFAPNQGIKNTSQNLGVTHRLGLAADQGTKLLVRNQGVGTFIPNTGIGGISPHQGITRRLGLAADQSVSRLSSDQSVKSIVSSQGGRRGTTTTQVPGTGGSSAVGSTGGALHSAVGSNGRASGISTLGVGQTKTNQIASSQSFRSPIPRTTLSPGVVTGAKSGVGKEVKATDSSQSVRLIQRGGERFQRITTPKTSGDAKDGRDFGFGVTPSRFNEFGRRITTTPSGSTGASVSKSSTQVFSRPPTTQPAGTTRLNVNSPQLLTTSIGLRGGASPVVASTSSFRRSSSHSSSRATFSTSSVAPTTTPTLARPHKHPSPQVLVSSPTQPSTPRAQATTSTRNPFTVSTKTPIPQRQASPSLSHFSSLTPSPQHLQNPQGQVSPSLSSSSSLKPSPQHLQNPQGQVSPSLSSSSSLTPSPQHLQNPQGQVSPSLSSSSSLTPSSQRLKNPLSSVEKDRVQSIFVAQPPQVPSSPRNQQFRVVVSAPPKIPTTTSALSQTPLPVSQKPFRSSSSSSRKEPLTIVTPTLTRPGTSPKPDWKSQENVSVHPRFTHNLPPPSSGTPRRGNTIATSGATEGLSSRDKDLKRDVEGDGPNTLILGQNTFGGDIDPKSRESFEDGSNDDVVFRVNTGSSGFSGINRGSSNNPRTNTNLVSTVPNQVVTFDNDDDDNGVTFGVTIPSTSPIANILPAEPSGRPNTAVLRPVLHSGERNDAKFRVSVSPAIISSLSSPEIISGLSSTHKDGDEDVTFRVNANPGSISSIASLTAAGLRQTNGVPLTVKSIPSSVASLRVTGLASPIAADDDSDFDDGGHSRATLNTPLITQARPVFVVRNAGDDISSLFGQNNAQGTLVGSPNSATVVNSNGDDEITFKINTNTSPSVDNSFISFNGASGTGGASFASSTSSSFGSNPSGLGGLSQASSPGSSSARGGIISSTSFGNAPETSFNLVGVGGPTVSSAATKILSPVRNNDDDNDVTFVASTVAPVILNTSTKSNLNVVGSPGGNAGVGVPLPIITSSNNPLSSVSGSSFGASGTNDAGGGVSGTGVPLPSITIGSTPSGNQPMGTSNDFGHNPFSSLSASANPFDRMLANLFDADSGFRVVRPSDLGNLEQPISTLLEELDDVAVIPISKFNDGSYGIRASGLPAGLNGATGVPLENAFGGGTNSGEEALVGRVEGGSSTNGGIVIGQENIGGGVTIGDVGNFGFGGRDLSIGTGNSGAGSLGEGKKVYVSSSSANTPVLSSSSSSTSKPSAGGQTIFLAPSDDLMKEVISLVNSEPKAASSEPRPESSESVGGTTDDSLSATPSGDDELDEITKLLESLGDPPDLEEEEEEGSTYFSTNLSDILFVKGKWIGTLLGGLIDIGKVVREKFKEETAKGF